MATELIPLGLLFEVLDKEPAVSVYWFALAPIGLVGVVITYFVRPFAVVSVGVSLIASAFFLSELWDCNINASIWAEDPTYLPIAYAAMLFSILLPGLAFLLSPSRSKKIK